MNTPLLERLPRPDQPRPPARSRRIRAGADVRRRRLRPADAGGGGAGGGAAGAAHLPQLNRERARRAARLDRTAAPGPNLAHGTGGEPNVPDACVLRPVAVRTARQEDTMTLKLTPLHPLFAAEVRRHRPAADARPGACAPRSTAPWTATPCWSSAASSWTMTSRWPSARRSARWSRPRVARWTRTSTRLEAPGRWPTSPTSTSTASCSPPMTAGGCSTSATSSGIQRQQLQGDAGQVLHAARPRRPAGGRRHRVRRHARRLGRAAGHDADQGARPGHRAQPDLLPRPARLHRLHRGGAEELRPGAAAAGALASGVAAAFHLPLLAHRPHPAAGRCRKPWR